MKKIILSVLSCIILTLAVSAENMPDLKYKNISNKGKISYSAETGSWSKNINKKAGNYYIKTKGFGDYYDYVDSEKNFAFSTNCEYEFIYENRLIGYSNKDMKFYEFSLNNGNLEKKPLSKEDIATIFSDYRVIDFSEFSQKTNSLKIKKHFGDLRIILLNNTNYTFENYSYTSGNAKFNQYALRGFITISKPGMIQFSGDSSSDHNLWYILLVR